MKEGLEKYFEGADPAKGPEALPEVQTENQQHAEINVQEGQGEIFQEEVHAQEQSSQEEVLEQEVIEIGDVPAEPQLEVVGENEDTPIDLPEGIDKLVEFINETGGTLQDYVNLNKDFSDYSESQTLTEYYKATKPHLDSDDIKYLVNKTLNANEEEMDEFEYREKRIAIKEELSKAQAHLQGNKERYYADLKKVATKEDPALLAKQKANADHFSAETEKVFEGFKGFNFSLGEGKPDVRFRVDNADKLKETQSDLNNVVGRFLDSEGKVEDAYAYHKALFAMQNADKIAQLFYEQGKADAIKEKAKDSKNIDFDPQLAPAKSAEKLRPGQAREIESPNTAKPGIRLKYGWK